LNDDSFNETPNLDAAPALDIDDARDRIWNYLFKTKSARPLDDLAAIAGCDVATARAAVSHEWFRVSGDQVSIAYGLG
jgi:hypothetical protein